MNMRNHHSILFFLFLFLLACNHLEEDDSLTGLDNEAGIPFKFSASCLKTKLSVDNNLHMSWTEGDEITLFHAPAGTDAYVKDGTFTAIADGDEVTFCGSLAEYLTEEEYDWYAFSGSVESNNVSPSKCLVSIGNSFCTDRQDAISVVNGFPMAGKACSVPNDAVPHIQMEEVSSLIRFVIINGLSYPINLSNSYFVASQEPIAGPCTIDFTGSVIKYNISETDINGHTDVYHAWSTVSRKPELSPGDTLFLYTNIKPFKAKKGSVLEMQVLAVGNGLQKKTIRLGEDYSFNAGEVYTLYCDYKKETSDSPIIEFEDPIMEEVCVSWFDVNLDGKLSIEEASEVEELSDDFVSYFYGQQGIKSFNELQYFTSLKRIGDHAFSLANTLEEIIIPDSVEEIGRQAFLNLSNLKVFNFPSSLKTIGPYAFSGCGCFDGELSLPSGVTSISDGAFKYTSITSLVLHEGITEIGSFSFGDCSHLSEVDFGQVRSIGYGAFDGCSSLTDVYLPESIKTLSESIFRSCYNLRSFSGKGASSDGKSLVLNGYLYAYACGGTMTPDVSFPEDVKSIGEFVFENMEWESFDIPDGVESVGWGAFFNCTRLKSIIIADSVYSLDSNAFAHCESLDDVTLPKSLLTLGNWAFGNCTNLRTVYCKCITPPDVSSVAFVDTALETVFVPSVCLPAYELFWEDYKAFLKPYEFPDLGDLEDYYSTDFSADGLVSQIQTAEDGNGIDIVIMGDYFSDRQIADGTYYNAIKKTADAFFDVEPYSSYRHLFNVYCVNVTSPSEGYMSLSGNIQRGVFGIYFGEGTHVGGKDSKVSEYALKAIPSSRMDNAVIIVVINREYYAGTCYMYTSGQSGDYGSGLSISYFPLDKRNFSGLVSHEAGGHGFAKLGDEYFYTETIPTKEVERIESFKSIGWYKNVDVVNDIDRVKWRGFLLDSRYESEELGIYEGAATYRFGAYRPSITSIMDNNHGGYNAPSRYAIWYRIHKLSYGDSWTGTYEDFVEYDLPVNVNSKNSPKYSRKISYDDDSFVPLAPPVVIDSDWRHLINDSSR